MSTLEPQRAFSLLDPVLDIMAAVEVSSHGNDTTSPPVQGHHQPHQQDPPERHSGLQGWTVPQNHHETRGPQSADLPPVLPPQWGLVAQQQQQAPPSAAPSLSRVASGVMTRARTTAAQAAAAVQAPQLQPAAAAASGVPPSPCRHGSGSRSVLSQVNAGIDTPPCPCARASVARGIFA